MRLLSPQEVINDRRRETDTAIAKGTKLASLVDKERKTLNTLRSEKEKEKEKIETEFGSFFTEITARKSVLESEVVGLESRRTEALKPLEQIKTELNERQEALNDKDADVSKREQWVSVKEEGLAGRISETEKKEKSLKGWEQTLTTTDSAYQIKGEDLKKKESKMADDFRKSTDYIIEKESETSRRETELGDKEKALQMKFGELDNQREEIRKDREHLYSQQEDLRLAFVEARKLRI